MVKDRKKYEKSRVRKFLPKWKEGYKWLSYDEAGEIMFCEVCREYPNIADKKSSFYEGTDAFRLDNIVGHDKSKLHNKCYEKQTLDERKSKSSDTGEVYGPLLANFLKIDKSVQEELIKLFNTAYFIVLNEMSFKTFPDLIKLQAKNSNCFSGKYANDQACRRFVHFIHKEIENPIYQKIRDANVISVLFDGSTDSSVKEIELVYVRLLENGIPNNVYFR